MPYIDTKHLFKCETCRSMRSGECTAFCDAGECYSPDITKIPTADVVEVVRCKDCKKFMEYSDAHKRAVERADGDCFLKQTRSYDEQFIACRYNDFCSYGERKDKVNA